MDARLEELLERLVAPGSFPNMSASEGGELVQLVYDLNKATGIRAQLDQDELRGLRRMADKARGYEDGSHCLVRIDEYRDTLSKAEAFDWLDKSVFFFDTHTEKDICREIDCDCGAIKGRDLLSAIEEAKK